MRFFSLAVWPALAAGATDAEACEELRLLWTQAAEKGLDFYAVATSHGTELAEPKEARIRSAKVAAADAVTATARFQEQGEEVVSVCGDNASIAARFFYLLLEQRVEGRRRISEGEALDPNIFLLSEVPWLRLLHGGWPTFALAALVESEFRDPPTVSLAAWRVDREDPSEGCTAVEEDFHGVIMLYAGEGRTVRVTDIQRFLQIQVQAIKPEDPIPEELGCPVAKAVGFAALADALQCHWRRPSSKRMHELADMAVHKAQEGALQAFGQGPLAFNAMIRSRWPLLSFLSRLRVRSGTDQVLVSWSSREVESGGANWAGNFAREVFSGQSNVELEEDVDCADIYIYRSKVPVNFGGVLIFVDGERSPSDTLQEERLQRYPASIVVGSMPAGGSADFFASPPGATSFSARLAHSPAHLLQPREMEARSRFAAYLVYKCYPHRERFFTLLDAAAKAAQLGSVESLSRCGNAPPDMKRRSERYAANYYDEAVELYQRYRFAIVFENRLSTRYVTEKIVNAFLGGAIPIYWGSPYVLQLFNPQAFIYVNAFETFEAAVEYVVEVASDAQALERYVTAPILRNTTAARWPFSWHREAPSVDGPTLREALAALALEKHHAGQRGPVRAAERRIFQYSGLF